MKRTHLIAVLLGLVALCIFAADASAYYHPGVGRFMSRDPGAGNANRIGTGGAAVAGGFIPMDQYADGMNLYQCVGSNPVRFIDPQGLARLNYSYSLAIVKPQNEPDAITGASGGDTRTQTDKYIDEFGPLIRKDAENLLWKYGVNAWDVNDPAWSIIPQKITVTGFFGDTTYDLYDLHSLQGREAKAANAAASRGGDDVIIFFPGNIFINEKPTVGGHNAITHIIGISCKQFTADPDKVAAIAHEILHHLLKKTITPDSADPAHDTEGLMHPSGGAGGPTRKLGHHTVCALKDKGVTDNDIDQSLIIKK